MDSPLKILIIDNSRALTGAFKSILLTTSQINRCEFSFALPASSTLIHTLKEKKIHVLPVGFLEISKSLTILLYLPVLIWNSIKILRFLKKNQISIVHVNDIYNMCGVLIKILSPSTRLVYHVRLLPDSYVSTAFPFFARLVVRYSDKVICNSYTTKKGLGLASEKIEVIYNPLGQDEKLPSKKIDSAEAVTLLHLANFTPGKGHELALEVFALAYKTNSSLRLILAGGTLGIVKNEAFKNSLERKARALGVKSAVTFRGFQENVEATIKEADIVLNFSTSESFSRVILEALYYGTPVIATNSGGPSEIIVNEKTGMLLPVGDVQGLAKAIITLSPDVQLRRNFSQAGREHVIRKFDARLIADQMESVYFNIAASNIVKVTHHP